MGKISIFGAIDDKCSIIGEETLAILREVYGIVQIGIPILVTVLCIIDFVRAIAAQDEKDMKAAQAKAVKRIIIGLAAFFIPLLLDVILKLAGLASGTCSIGG